MSVLYVQFVVLSGFTVPNNYSWDQGVPSRTTNTLVSTYTTQDYISGYAPSVQVFLFNDSIPEYGFDNVTYEWNFGDYYNNSTNRFALSCNSIVEHNYVMPGTYTVSMKLLQTKRRDDFDETGNSKLCLGRYNLRWFWDELNQEKETALTWDDTAIGSPREKNWDDEVECFEKYCKLWTWKDLSTDFSNPVSWDNTASDTLYTKKWMFEGNDTICKVENADFLTSVNTIEQTVIKNFLVEVKEKPPIAGMHCVTRPSGGVSPLTIQLTPRLSLCGSFPIERIDWDFNDGSPIKTINRYTANLSATDLIYNDAFPLDPLDVRNYDVLHTYVKTKNSYSIFYPSLTCYSANTNTSDSCSIAIGPVSLSSVSTQTALLKNRNTIKGNLYTIDIGNNVGFFTTNEISSSQIVSVNLPSNTIRDTYGQIPFDHYGNTGEGYPPSYEPDCSRWTLILPQNYVSTEDSTPTTITDMLSDDGEAILSETLLTFIP